jgi:hypothetical protein
MKNGMREMANLAGWSTALNRWSQGKILALLATGLLAVPATSSAIVLDFEGVGDNALVADFYNGVGGPDYDIVFSGGNLALEEGGISGLFESTPSGITAMFNADSSADIGDQVTVTLNSAVGFTSVSFYYAALVAGFVKVYDGADGSGNEIYSDTLAVNQSSTCSDSAILICDWTNYTQALFSGTARSIVFGGANAQIGFDDITLAPVPLPAAAWLLLSGLAGLGVFGRRRAAA